MSDSLRPLYMPKKVSSVSGIFIHRSSKKDNYTSCLYIGEDKANQPLAPGHAMKPQSEVDIKFPVVFLCSFSQSFMAPDFKGLYTQISTAW